MLKRLFHSLLAFACIVTLTLYFSLQIFAENIVDECDGNPPDDTQIYQMNYGSGSDANWDTSYDDTFLTASDGSSITYHLSKIDRIQLGLYTRYGLLAAKSAEDNQRYLMSTHPLAEGHATNIYYDTSQGLLFIRVDNAWLSGYYDEDLYSIAFRPNEKQPDEGALIPYGPTISVSDDGERFQSVSYSIDATRSAGSFTYHTLSASLPEGTQYVKITFRSFSSLPSSSGGSMEAGLPFDYALSSVSLVGSVLSEPTSTSSSFSQISASSSSMSSTSSSKSSASSSSSKVSSSSLSTSSSRVSSEPSATVTSQVGSASLSTSSLSPSDNSGNPNTDNSDSPVFVIQDTNGSDSFGENGYLYQSGENESEPNLFILNLVYLLIILLLVLAFLFKEKIKRFIQIFRRAAEEMRAEEQRDTKD